MFSQQNEARTVTFQFDFPGSEPDHYSISIPEDGHASYESISNAVAGQSVTDPYRLDFTVSEKLRTRVFELAKRADYFQEKIDSGNKKLAFTGSKSLAYSAAGKTSIARYNYSSLQTVQQLTKLFASMSSTLEFGRRLEYDYKYQKLALDDELRNMESMAAESELAEIEVVAPILEKIAADSSLVNVARVRAQRLLVTAGI